MIDKGSFEKAIGAAEAFALKGLTVLPVEGTPLAQLVNTTNLVSGLTFSGESAEVIQSHQDQLSMTSDNQEHSSFYDDYVNGLSTGLGYQISNARNIINPIVNDAVEKVRTLMTEANSSPYSFEIKQVDLPQPMQNMSLVEEIETNAQGSLLPPRNRIILRGMSTPQGIVDAMVTGSELFDSAIRDWVGTIGEERLAGIWAKTFAPATESNLEMVPELLQAVSGPDATETALVVYLVARKLFDNIPDETGMDLATWKGAVRDYLTVSSIVLKREITSAAARANNNSLIVGLSKNNQVVSVSGKVYRDYIATGGKNEIIFGAITLGEIPYNVGALLEYSEKYQKAWDNYASINKSILRNKAFDSFKEICEYVLISQLNELAEFESEQLEKNPDFMVVVSNSYKEQIKLLTMTSLDDVYQTVMMLVTTGRFPYTDSYRFLNSMNQAAKADPDIDPREAATLAVCEYVCDHLSDQMRVA